MKVKESSKNILTSKIPALALEVEKSAPTVYRWINYTPHLLKKRHTLKAIKKVTGLTEEQIFEK